MAHDSEDRPAYDPTEPAAPDREPPLRSTAPQSAFTSRQVAIGVAITLIGLVATVGLPLALA